ncbi:MAG: FtsX-like permease family protein [Planctomycetota bacterium]
MYKLLLISKYLRRKLAPLFAAVAVAMCTFMVIVVISVMGGFLDLLRDAAQKLTGDVTVLSQGLTGFENYEGLLEELRELPEVAVATPVIDTFGLLEVRGRTQPVRVQGVVMEELAEIVDYRDTVMWGNEDMPERWGEWLRPEPDLREWAVRLEVPPNWTVSVPGLDEDEPAEEADVATVPAMVMGVEVLPYQRRLADGSYRIDDSQLALPVRLTVAPLGADGQLGAYRPDAQQFRVINEFKSGLYEVDKQTVYVPFDWLQEALEMHSRDVWPAGSFDEETGRRTGDPVRMPGRAGSIAIKAAPGVSADMAADAIRPVVEAYITKAGVRAPLAVLTWEQVHGQLLGAVQNEKVLITFLFCIISLVAVVMVATTFYMIVLEKTRDIGVLRAIGAGRGGVMGMFVGYGLAIGVVGSIMGALGAWTLVTHLNEVQEVLATKAGTLIFWVVVVLAVAVLTAVIVAIVGRKAQGDRLGLSLIAAFAAAVVAGLIAFGLFDQPSQIAWLAVFNQSYGFRMWNPQTYLFDRIPDRVDAVEAVAIVVGAIVSSVVGSLIPAFLAGRLDPVEALRYE